MNRQVLCICLLLLIGLAGCAEKLVAVQPYEMEHFAQDKMLFMPLDSRTTFEIAHLQHPRRVRGRPERIPGRLRMPMIRRILALFVACMLLPVWPVIADKPRDGMSYRFNYYGDNGNNMVISPSVLLSKKLTDTYYLGTTAGVDAITSATKQAPTTRAASGGGR